MLCVCAQAFTRHHHAIRHTDYTMHIFNAIHNICSAQTTMNATKSTTPTEIHNLQFNFSSYARTRWKSEQNVKREKMNNNRGANNDELEFDSEPFVCFLHLMGKWHINAFCMPFAPIVKFDTDNAIAYDHKVIRQPTSNITKVFHFCCFFF